jgi:citrate synthase
LGKRKYSREEKYTVAVYLMIHGSQTKAAEMSGINKRIISHWVHHDNEFKEMYQQAVEKGKLKFDSMTSSLIDSSLDMVRAKLNHERKLMQEGEGRLSAKDAALTAKILHDVRQISRSLPTSITEKRTTDHLDDLAKKFEDIAAGKVPSDEPTLTDKVH